MIIVYTKHAREMLVFRKIKKTQVRKCIKQPNKVIPVRDNRKAYLKNFGRNFLKVIVSEDKGEITIITLYWIAKKRIEK